MTVILVPLLNIAETLLGTLWRARMVKEAVILLPDWMECRLDDVAGNASKDEAALRERLCAFGAQLAAVGLAVSVRAVLARGGDQDRQAQLIALACSAGWSGDAAAVSRGGADGSVYTLRTAVAGPAWHAQHAALTLSQTLRIDVDGVGSEICRTVGTRCLSISCALRDAVVRLLETGETALACQVARLSLLPDALLPAAVETKEAAMAVRLAG